MRESQGPARAGQSWDGDAVRAIFARGKKREFSSHRNAKDHWREKIDLSEKIRQIHQNLINGFKIVRNSGKDLAIQETSSIRVGLVAFSPAITILMAVR